MISFAVIEQAMYEAMRRAATMMPPDIEHALKRVLDEETLALAKKHIEVSLENARLAAEGRGLVCGDTGFPLYYITAGGGTEIEGGFGMLWDAARSATARATGDNYLRPTMVDPLSRDNPGDNVGPGMPGVDLTFSGDGGGLTVIAAPKGGGSEIFGTFYTMMYPADGEAGIFKFVTDSIRKGVYAGKVCPPAIVGVGIGGTADICMHMAKKAAVLRPPGTIHPDPRCAEMEAKLFRAARKMGLGPMGGKGLNPVLGVHIELAVTHTAALPVAVNAQCLIGRRWKAVIDSDGSVDYSGELL